MGLHDEEGTAPIRVPSRLARRALGREWPIENAVGGFAATRAQTALGAHVSTLGHILLEVLALPWVARSLAKRSRLTIVVFSASQYAVMPLPALDGSSTPRQPVGALTAVELEERGCLSGIVRIAGVRHFVPRRQHRDLERIPLAQRM